MGKIFKRIGFLLCISAQSIVVPRIFLFSEVSRFMMRLAVLISAEMYCFFVFIQ